jgi:large subunit ribosomal protein L10e
MASLRKASSYSKKKVRPFTRKSNRRQKAYIKAIPPSKIVKFQMGNSKAFRQGKHNYSVSLVSKEKVQLRDNALESGRMMIVKVLDKGALGQYNFTINVYPHHILRENKTAAGAGADRLSSGMKHSFGITIGRAAIVNPGKEIFKVTCETEKNARLARDVLMKVKPKMPCKSAIRFEKLK